MSFKPLRHFCPKISSVKVVFAQLSQKMKYILLAVAVLTGVQHVACALECHVCMNAADWAECSGTEVCDTNDIYLCEARYQSSVGLYNAGCKQAKACSRHGELACPNDKTGEESNMCFYCCDGDNCNYEPPQYVGVKECDDPQKNNCSEYADCDDKPYPFSCACKIGFSGNGVECDDNDECASTPCQNNATCNNLINSYTCDCEFRYIGYNCEGYMLYRIYWSDDGSDFLTANAHCNDDYGGRVAHMTSSSINDFLADAIVGFLGETLYWDWWIDGQDLGGSWVHSDGTPLTYTNFLFGPDTDGTNKHIIMSVYPGQNYTWFKKDASYLAHGFICEKTLVI